MINSEKFIIIGQKEVNMFDIYILETCPYCKKVLSFMDENDIKYNKVDISEKQQEDALIQLGGKRQVPFLVDKERNIQMYESSDIIEYLKTVI